VIFIVIQSSFTSVSLIQGYLHILEKKKENSYFFIDGNNCDRKERKKMHSGDYDARYAQFSFLLEEIAKKGMFLASRRRMSTRGCTVSYMKGKNCP
jgi:hypothetical protein